METDANWNNYDCNYDSPLEIPLRDDADNGDTPDAGVVRTSSWYSGADTSLGCSPMMTHCHLLQRGHQRLDRRRGATDDSSLPRHRTPSSSRQDDDTAKRRSRSLGSESDLLLRSTPASTSKSSQGYYFASQPLGISLVPPLKPVSLSPTNAPSAPLTPPNWGGDADQGNDATQQEEQERPIIQPPLPYEPLPPNPLYISILYGVINACIVLPVLMSFGSIIYRDPFFSPYMPVLIKLTVISGTVHQLCFSTLSSLPFAVGQVQDAGLVFLSKMAADLVRQCRAASAEQEQEEEDPAVVLATVTVGLGLATALLGVGLVVLGRLQLARYVQRLPTPVIGGYLAFIGYFCGVSGLELMAGGSGGGTSNAAFRDVAQHVALVAPGLAGGILMYLLARKIRHMAVLPACIVVLLAVFYAGLAATGTTVAEATALGWIRASDRAPLAWYRSWDLLRLDKVAWRALPSQGWTLLGMLFVVALSSSLDVAAIGLELNRPLQYDGELTVVGISNLVSGMMGGYTGSYIFSQSIFSLRAGITSRAAGYCLALCQFGCVALPLPLLAYVPNFFFGSLLVMICVDLLHEWLWQVRLKLSGAEHFVCLSTFGLIQWTGVECGILLGVALSLALSKLGLVGVDKAADDDEEEEERKSETEDTGRKGSKRNNHDPTGLSKTAVAATYGTIA